MKKNLLIICGIILALILAIPIKDTIIECSLRQKTIRALAKAVDTLSLEFKDNQYINANLELVDFVKTNTYNDHSSKVETVDGHGCPIEYYESKVNSYEYKFYVNLINNSKYNIYQQETNKVIKPNSSIDLEITKEFSSKIEELPTIEIPIPVYINKNVKFKFLGKDMCLKVPIYIYMNLTTNSDGESGILEFSGASASIPKKDFINEVSKVTSKGFKVDDSDTVIDYSYKVSN